MEFFSGKIPTILEKNYGKIMEKFLLFHTSILCKYFIKSNIILKPKLTNQNLLYSYPLDDLIAAGMFETKPIEEVKPGLELVTKLAKEKIDKNRKTVEERKIFGVNKALRDPTPKTHLFCIIETIRVSTLNTGMGRFSSPIYNSVSLVIG